MQKWGYMGHAQNKKRFFQNGKSGSQAFKTFCFSKTSNVLTELLMFYYFVWCFFGQKNIIFSHNSRALISVLLTKFGLSVSSIWSTGLIEKLTIMKWPCNFQSRYMVQQARYILHFVLTRSLNQENLRWNCFALTFCWSISFTSKNIFYVG